jgi:hypothetical protein
VSLKTQILADGPVFVSSSEFGESVTYTQSGVATVMDAVVLRGDMARVQAVGGRSYSGIMIKVLIPVATLPFVKERLDTVAVRLRPEQSVDTTFRVTKILDQDAGMWTLELEG